MREHWPADLPKPAPLLAAASPLALVRVWKSFGIWAAVSLDSTSMDGPDDLSLILRCSCRARMLSAVEVRYQRGESLSTLNLALIGLPLEIRLAVTIYG